MASNDGQKPNLKHYCRYGDYIEAVNPTWAGQDPTGSESAASRHKQTLPTFIIVTPANTTTKPPSVPLSVPASIDAPVDSGDEEREEEPHPLRKSKRPRRRSTGGTTHHGRAPTHARTSQGTKEMNLKLDEHVDDYTSEAEMSGLDDYYRSENRVSERASSEKLEGQPRQRSKKPSSQPQQNGSDSSCSDGECAYERKAEVFDSDLESVVSDVGKAAHAKKMRRWKSLARDKFEKMLLDCIVNTGRCNLSKHGQRLH
jgi:hypothetical protein